MFLKRIPIYFQSISFIYFKSSSVCVLFDHNCNTTCIYLVDAGELQVDHFIGQESPGAAPPVSHSNSSTSLFAATSFTCEDSFDVGYGSAPPTHDSSLLNSFHTTADQQANPVSSQSSVSAPVSQYYQPTHQPPASGIYSHSILNFVINSILV